ncbi:MAG: hypothetical protein ACPL4E_10875, partial [Thermoproteota archaeon]
LISGSKTFEIQLGTLAATFAILFLFSLISYLNISKARASVKNLLQMIWQESSLSGIIARAKLLGSS